MIKTFVAGLIAGCIASAALGDGVSFMESTGAARSFAVKYLFTNYPPQSIHMVGESPTHKPTAIQTDEDGHPLCWMMIQSPNVPKKE